jgi:hypothetical protein
MTQSRVVLKSSRSSLLEEMLQSLLVAEAMNPSDEIWIVSPWMRNVPVIDNRGGGFSWVESTWEGRRVHLLDWILAVCAKGSQVTVVTSDGELDQDFVRGAKDIASRLPDPGLLRVHSKRGVQGAGQGGLHSKLLLTRNFFWQGSMNFTLPGLRAHQETVSVFLPDWPEFSKVELEVRQLWGEFEG